LVWHHRGTDHGGAATTAKALDGRANTRISVGLSAVGLILVAVSFLAPGFRPGDVVGANIGGGLLLMLGWLLVAAGVVVGIVRAVSAPRNVPVSAAIVVLPLAATALLWSMEQQQLDNYADPSAYQVSIVNDEAQRVGVAVCVGEMPNMCSATEPTQDLAPREVAVADDGYQTAYPWQVTTPDGSVLGCLVLPTNAGPGTTSTVNVSSAKNSLC
jgi:hypothetical protein